jgi:hypothetical protein
VITKTQDGGPPRRWAPPILFTWMLCVPVSAWLQGGQEDCCCRPASSASRSVSPWCGNAAPPAALPTVLTASLLATISASLSSSYALVISSYDPVIGFVYFVQALGLPVAAGALLGAVWRLVLRLRKRRMSDW